MKKINMLGALAIGAFFAGSVTAAPLTGEPVGNDFGWEPECNSTNALNYAQQVPCRLGQIVPYVLLNESGPGFVVLDFFNHGPGLAFFEFRIDGVQAGTNQHPVVTGDLIHPGRALASGTDLLSQMFTASSFVDIRLALGGERDWDFDWTRFHVATVPEPGVLALFGMGLLGLGFARTRRRH